MMKRSGSFFASTALIASLLGGCATMMSGTTQSVDVQLIGAEKARCIISNEDYKYQVNAPAVVPIEKSRKDLTVECYGVGGKYTKFTMESMASGDTAINIMNGIVPGTAVDITSGAAFTYPKVLVVNFDESTGPRVKRDPRGPVWPENMADVEPVKVEPDFVEVPKAIVEPAAPEDELQEPMSAIKLLHEKMNPIANQHRAMPIIEDADAAQAPQAIIEADPSTLMPQGGTAPLEPVAPVGQSFSAPLEIGTAVAPIRNSQMQPVMDDPIKPKAAPSSSAPKAESAEPAPKAESAPTTPTPSPSGAAPSPDSAPSEPMSEPMTDEDPNAFMPDTDMPDMALPDGGLPPLDPASETLPENDGGEAVEEVETLPSLILEEPTSIDAAPEAPESDNPEPSPDSAL